MQPTPDTIFEAASKLPEDERWSLVSRLLETMPVDSLGSSIDDPELLSELDRRFSDGAEGIPWSALRDEE